MTTKNYLNFNNIYPLTKVIIAITFVLSLFLIPGIKYQFISILVIFVIAIISGTFKVVLPRFIKATLALVVIMVIFQTFFFKADDVLFEFWILTATKSGLMNGIRLASRVMGMTAMVLLLSSTTKSKDFIYTIEVLGIPKKGAYVIMSTLQIIPEMSNNMNKIREAQNSRGMETEGNLLIRAKTIIPSLAPLVISALESSSERVLALESRAFSSTNKKSHLHEIHPTKVDKIIAIVSVLILIGLIIWKVVSII